MGTSTNDARTILVTDDDEIQRSVLMIALRARGFTLLEARNGAQAIQIYDQHMIDLLVMDVRMPILDGIEATRRIREKESNRVLHFPIIGVSACAFEQDRERALAAGMDEYLVKPVRVSDLTTAVGRYLRGYDEFVQRT